MTGHRRLAPDEAALWEMVARTVKPLHPPRQRQDDRPPLAERPLPQPAPAAALRRADAGPRKGPAPAKSAGTAQPSPAPTPSETLDGAWDRRIASGRLKPDRTIDLHGLSLEAARHRLYDLVAASDARGERVLLVITGKGQMPGPAPADLMPGLGGAHGGGTRGAIRVSLPRWIGEAGLSGRIAAVRRAHPRHGGAGAVYLILKRRRG